MIRILILHIAQHNYHEILYHDNYIQSYLSLRITQMVARVCSLLPRPLVGTILWLPYDQTSSYSLVTVVDLFF